MRKETECTFSVLVDSHSKWLEVFPTKSTTSQETIEILPHLFARYGFPQELGSKNGPQFTSGEFETFCQHYGIRHTLIPPYHPATNGVSGKGSRDPLLRDLLTRKHGGHPIPLQATGKLPDLPNPNTVLSAKTQSAPDS